MRALNCSVGSQCFLIACLRCCAVLLGVARHAMIGSSSYCFTVVGACVLHWQTFFGSSVLCREVSRVVIAMRNFVFMCCACAAVASSVGDVDGRYGTFLASLSGRRVSSNARGGVEGEYGRETHSPTVWLNLRKSNLDVEALSKGIGTQNYASKQLS